MIKIKDKVNKTEMFKELKKIGKKRFEFTCEPDEDLKVFLDGAEQLFKLLRLTDVVKSLPSEDLKFIYSLLPEWTKEAPSGLNPTLYGTLTQEGDQKVIDRLNEILK